MKEEKQNKASVQPVAYSKEELEKLRDFIEVLIGVQFITPAGPRQSLLLAKEPDQSLLTSFIPHVYVSKPTTPISLRLT